MKIKSIFLLIVLIFAGCSFKTNERFKYRVDASNSFDSFKKYYLQGKTRLASISLKRALKNAKDGSDINSIAKIYLGECALHSAMLINDTCKEYQQIKSLTNDKSLENYYQLLRKNFKQIDTKFLPEQYKDFAENLKSKNYKNAINSLFMSLFFKRALG